MITIPMKVRVLDPVIPMKMSILYEPSPEELYEGPTEFTPSSQVQYAETRGKLVSDNIKINPIPSNYGLITYNGSIITVS